MHLTAALCLFCRKFESQEGQERGHTHRVEGNALINSAVLSISSNRFLHLHPTITVELNARHAGRHSIVTLIILQWPVSVYFESVRK